LNRVFCSAPISKVIGYLPPNIPRVLINRTVVHPAHSTEDDSEDGDEKDFRENYVFDAYLLGFCDDVTRALAKQLFAADNENEVPKEAEHGKLLATLTDEDDTFSQEDWNSIRAPRERVFLFPGAQAASGDDHSEPIYREIAHCDGCSERIVGTILKCSSCFDYDLCEKCYPRLSKTHYEGRHQFCEEEACPMEAPAC